jgi:Hemocyanin, ig-like domain/Hemocyanin, copper containing domain
MATLDELRERSDMLFTELLQTQATPPEPAQAFSWFDTDDAIAAATLSFRLAARAASGTTVEEGLAAALDVAEQEKGSARPEEVQIALALFVTHNRDGRRLTKPRTVTAAPELFSPPRVGDGRLAISEGGLSPGLDYWREDVLANEHHQHWHEVYPFTGIEPASFDDWATGHSTDDLVAILEGLSSAQRWADIVPTLTPPQLADLFDRVLANAGGLPRDLYGKLFRLNDRQGELFFYMHEQMLARYDAELLSNGLERVQPFGPDAWDKPIAAGHDPIEVEGFGERPPNTTLPGAEIAKIKARWDEIDAGLHAGHLRGLDGNDVPIDRENLGEAVESTVPQLRSLAEGLYHNLHGQGHVSISHLANPNGVMTSPVTAIRDPVFWQWHKAIDDISARWQDTPDPYPFDDNPPVRLRDSLDGTAAKPWSSPDIILCRTVDLPDGVEPSQLGTQLFAGDNWTKDFTKAQASAGGTTLRTVDELTTSMGQALFGGNRIAFLQHEPFSYFVRIENTSGGPVDVTVRIFLAPEELENDRRAWIELDKFLVELPGENHVVVYRPDTESSVVKRPVDISPARVPRGGSDPNENSYCDCGWPYTLLLPRGKPEGMPFRLLVLCTDATIDRVTHAEHCGSMSYCGAVDRYPDTRDMGYPFSRPFGPEPNAIRDKILGLDCAAARTVSIRHAV